MGERKVGREEDDKERFASPRHKNISFVEKLGDADWWSEKGERGEMEEARRRMKIGRRRLKKIARWTSKARERENEEETRRGKATSLFSFSFFQHDEIYILHLFSCRMKG